MTLADLASGGPRPLSGPRLAGYGVCAVAIAALFGVLVWLGGRYDVWRKEHYRDPRMGVPTRSECVIARTVLADLHGGSRDVPARAVGDGAGELELRVLAWRSDGAPVAGGGVDWRACPGLPAYARAMGLAHLGAHAGGPTIYVSRPTIRAAGDVAQVIEVFQPPAFFHRGDADQGQAAVRAATRRWTTTLRRIGVTDRWRIDERRDGPPEPAR